MRIILMIILYACPLFLSAQKNWTLLENSPFNGSKQDDLFFVDRNHGFALNGSGEIWSTENAGESWKKLVHFPGTYFRCMGWLDAQHGFAGNLAPGFFENVSDINPLYETKDGGLSWQVVTNIDGPQPTGLCAIDVVNDSTLYAGGRVSGPAYLLKSTNKGATWTSTDMSPWCQMVMDVKFFHPDTGFVFAATHDSIEIASASILYTTNGGESWEEVFRTKRIHEICWKASFPTRKTGYVSILSYSNTHPNRFVIKTSDGGLSWKELPLQQNACVAFGIGFVDEKWGWVGTDLGGYFTKNGGKKWKKAKMGKYTNKIRFYSDDSGIYGYAIGERVYHWKDRRFTRKTRGNIGGFRFRL